MSKTASFVCGSLVAAFTWLKLSEQLTISSKMLHRQLEEEKKQHNFILSKCLVIATLTYYTD